jgi:hypothetical protein
LYNGDGFARFAYVSSSGFYGGVVVFGVWRWYNVKLYRISWQYAGRKRFLRFKRKSIYERFKRVLRFFLYHGDGFARFAYVSSAGFYGGVVVFGVGRWYNVKLYCGTGRRYGFRGFHVS